MSFYLIYTWLKFTSNFLDQNNPKSQYLNHQRSVQFHSRVNLFEDSEWSPPRALKQRKSPVMLSNKWSRSLTGAVAYKSFKTKEKSSWVIQQVVAVAYELSTTKFKSQFKQGCTKMVITRAGRLQEWSQGELRLYIGDFDCLRRRLTNKI